MPAVQASREYRLVVESALEAGRYLRYSDSYVAVEELGMASRNSGFTLVEVVVASFLLAFAFAGILVSLSAMSRTARMADEVNRASHNARQVIEDLRTHSFADPELALGTRAITNGFYVVWATAATSTLRRVTVTQYAVVRGRTAQVEMTTLLTRALHE